MNAGRPQAHIQHYEALLTLTLLTCFTVLLVGIRAIGPSPFVAFGLPRAEWSSALLVALVGSAIGLFRRPTKTPGIFQFSIILPLSAVALLLLESLSLLLWPTSLALPLFPNPETIDAAIGDYSEVSFDVKTFVIGLALSGAALSYYLRPITDETRGRDVRNWLFACGVAACVSFLVPIVGPLSFPFPLPPTPVGPFAPYVLEAPRLGLIALPTLAAWMLIFGLVRRDRSVKRTRDILKWLALALALLVISLELLLKRYSTLSVLLSLSLAALVEFVPTAWRRRKDTQSLDTHPNSAAKEEPLRPSSVDPREPAKSRKTADARARALLTAVFFLSGMAALVYQVVFAKGLALTFGSTSHASTIVLATYMGGLALGSWLGGRLAERVAYPVRAYALAELGIAFLCAASPLTLKAARHLYVHIAEGADPSEGWLVALQLGLGAIVLVPPTLLMGTTLPFLTRQFLHSKSTLGNTAGLLYTANTLGAALGASVTGYAVLPAFGITRSLYAAVAINVLVSLFALIAAKVGRSTVPEEHASHDDKPELGVLVAKASPFEVAKAQTNGLQDSPASPHQRVEMSDPQALLLGLIAVVQLTIGGFVTFGLETSFIHLLATVAGTSAYAFSLMLFAFLIGLSIGATFGRKILPRPQKLASALLLCQLLLAVTLLFGSAYWDVLPAYFASFGRWPFTLTFAARELVRFVVCLLVMVPPALCIGAQFPIAMEAIGLGWRKQRVLALGRASALNTVGNILGAIIVGFVFLPRFGSHKTLAILTLLCLVLAALALIVVERRAKVGLSALVFGAAVGLFISPPSFDLTRLAAGGNVYFKPQYYGQVIDAAESLDGGLTTVTIAQFDPSHQVKTLLTNAKFQGNDRRDSSGEMVAQTSFAIAPLLHTEERGRALVIGFGTGTTTRVLDEAGFSQVVVAELSGDIVTLADRHFSTINNHVIHRPNVLVKVTDGRNFLLLDRQKYDLISIELSSIWFAGAANLYNDEFYALVEPRLTERGVLQQWVQLHRLSHRDIMSILVTLKQRFHHAWLYFLGKQGIIVACKHDCAPSPQAISRLLDEPRLATTLSVFPNGLRTVMQGRLLSPAALTALVEDYVKSSGQGELTLLSTDDNLYLEYSTPKGNVREYDESIADNEQFLARFRPPSLFDATRLTASDIAQARGTLSVNGPQ